MLEISNFSLKFPGFSLKNINMHVSQGDFFAIIGPTGSGKTLLLESIMGTVALTGVESSGKIILKGENITRLPPEKRDVGIVYQDSCLFPNMTVEENIFFGIKYGRKGKDSNKAHADYLIECLGIKKLLKRFPGKLSGGERQRVALARALVLKPSLLLLDEPLSAIDPVLKEEIRQLLQELHKRLEITVIMVSHSLQDIVKLAEKIAIMRQGALIQSGTMEEVLKSPKDSFVAKFMGLSNLFSVESKLFNNNLLKDALDPPVKRGGYVFINPERVKIMGIHSDNKDVIWLEGQVISIGYCKESVSIKTDVFGCSLEAIFHSSNLMQKQILPGHRIKVGFRAKDIRIL